MTPDHRFRLGDRVKVLLDSGYPLASLTKNLLPADTVVHVIVQLLPLDVRCRCAIAAAPFRLRDGRIALGRYGRPATTSPGLQSLCIPMSGQR